MSEPISPFLAFLAGQSAETVKTVSFPCKPLPEFRDGCELTGMAAAVDPVTGVLTWEASFNAPSKETLVAELRRVADEVETEG